MADPIAPQNNSADKPARAVIKDRDGIRDAIAALIETARREIIVFAPQMDAHFFNFSPLARSLASFAARHQRNRARILIEDASQVLRDNDRIAALCRRLPEFIQLRQVAEEHFGLREMFVVVEHVSYVHQPDITEPDCIVDSAGRERALELRRRFDRMWERSEPAAGLNTAGLAP